MVGEMKGWRTCWRFGEYVDKGKQASRESLGTLGASEGRFVI